jgi:general secretion pathway protein H
MCVARRGRPGTGGFTLIELLVVVAIIAVSAGLVSLALRDDEAGRLEREGARLSALLEAARAESRTMGVAVAWVPAGENDAPGFRFVGLPEAAGMPRGWLDPAVRAEISGQAQVLLGPDALIGAQRIVLHLGERELVLATDGLGPFEPAAEPAAAPG